MIKRIPSSLGTVSEPSQCYKKCFGISETEKFRAYNITILYKSETTQNCFNKKFKFQHSVYACFTEVIVCRII